MGKNNVINFKTRSNSVKTFNAQIISCVGPYYDGGEEMYAVKLIAENTQVIQAYITDDNFDDVLMNEGNYINVSGYWEKLHGSSIFQINKLNNYESYIEDEQAVVNRIFMFVPINVNGMYQLTNDVNKFSKKQRDFIKKLRRAQ